MMGFARWTWVLLVCATIASCQTRTAAGGAAGSAGEWNRFVDAEPAREIRYAQFVSSLRKAGVHDVVPPWQLWRQGTDWKRCRTPAFAVPPRKMWPGMVKTLRVLRDDVIPQTGPVEVVSGFRTRVFNKCAGGAKSSRHLFFEAVDVVPNRSWSRDDLHQTLDKVWTAGGRKTKLGLGLYAGVRFHVDTHRHRRW